MKILPNLPACCTWKNVATISGTIALVSDVAFIYLYHHFFACPKNASRGRILHDNCKPCKVISFFFHKKTNPIKKIMFLATCLLSTITFFGALGKGVWNWGSAKWITSPT